MRTQLAVLVALLSVAVVSGCTTTSSGTPLPGSSTSASSTEASSDDLPSDGAPKVENPLDVSQFEQSPCDVLTAEDANTLNVPATGRQDGDSSGESCYWNNPETRGSLSVSFLSSEDRGLSAVYARKGKYAYFEPIDDVEGHPGVAFNPDKDEPTIDCGVMVGVTDQLVFMTRVALSEGNVGRRKPCDAAAQAAGMMMKTMQEAA